jgi:hypothetical protein
LQSERIRWPEHVARFGRVRISYRVYRENLKLEDLVVNGMIMLEWIINKSVGKAWIELIWLRIRIMVGCYENDLSSFVIYVENLD